MAFEVLVSNREWSDCIELPIVENDEKNRILKKIKAADNTQFKIGHCEVIPELSGAAFAENATFAELNFLAKRIDDISKDVTQICAYRALMSELPEEQNSLFLLPDCFYREIPPELPQDYMARPDEIRENARKAMAIIDVDENLKFVREQSKNLSEKQLKHFCIPAIIGYSENIRKAIAEDDLITMRRYERPDRYLDSFRSAAEKLRSPEKINEHSAIYEAEDEEEFEDDFEEECIETEQLETDEITESIYELEEDLQLKFF